MIISDLNHLEVVSEASSVVGGDRKSDKKAKVGKLDLDLTNQSNVSVIDQDATAVAISYKGKATDTVYNIAYVTQINEA